jgi:poly(3-hydroxyalkanoate) synthetase
MKVNKANGELESRLTVEQILSWMNRFPARSALKYQTAVNWKSEFAGLAVRQLFFGKRSLDTLSLYASLWGPAMRLTADIQRRTLEKLFIDPIKTAARIAVRTGRHPDIFAEQNDWTKSTYARLIYDLCGRCITDGTFDPNKARRLTTTEQGKKYLRNAVAEFSWLEHNYNSWGRTGLEALKDLLKCFFMLITEQPVRNGALPYALKDEHAETDQAFKRYLKSMRRRFENLYAEKAFDVYRYSEIATRNIIGCSAFKAVPGSKLHASTLRYYPLPADVTANGKIVYLASPLINKPEIFDLAPGKSVIEGLLNRGFDVYLVENGEPGPFETDLGLSFYGQTLHDTYLDLIAKRHPNREIMVMAYCMAGTLMVPYLARRAQERAARGEKMDICKVVLMAAPLRFDDDTSGHGPMRQVIRKSYDAHLMDELFGDVNIPPIIIDMGMHAIQPGVRYNNMYGFFRRAFHREAVRDSAPFIYWLTHGTNFPARAHKEWIQKIYLENQIENRTYCLPSKVPELDGRPVDIDVLPKAGVRFLDYRGERDPISPPGSSLSSIMGGEMICEKTELRTGMRRHIEKNAGHIFVVSGKLLAEYIDLVTDFYLT